MHSYVYITLDKSDFSVKYVGSGKGDRCKHVLSGRSSSVKANRDVLSGAGDYATIPFIVGLSPSVAREIESGLIYTLQPDWNHKGLLDMPEVDFDIYCSCLRVKAYLNFLEQARLYNPKSFERYFSLAMLVFFQLVTEDNDFEYLYPELNRAVEYYLEEDEWINYFE